MSDNRIALCITVTVFAAMILWVPALSLLERAAKATAASLKRPRK